jgi:mRNA interferase MazF
MEKDFDEWNKIKKSLSHRHNVFCSSREVWWCSLGLNVGSEQNGEGSSYSRPVLIFKVFSADIFWGIPITSQAHTGPFYFKFNLGGNDQFVILSQIRIFSMKRLQRKITILPERVFTEIITAFWEILPKNEIPLAGEISEAEAIVSDTSMVSKGT